MDNDPRFYTPARVLFSVLALSFLLLLLFFARRPVSRHTNQTWLQYLGEVGLTGVVGTFFGLVAGVYGLYELYTRSQSPPGIKYWVQTLVFSGLGIWCLVKRFRLSLPPSEVVAQTAMRKWEFDTSRQVTRDMCYVVDEGEAGYVVSVCCRNVTPNCTSCAAYRVSRDGNRIEPVPPVALERSNKTSSRKPRKH
jgi:hypothetical protein